MGRILEVGPPKSLYIRIYRLIILSMGTPLKEMRIDSSEFVGGEAAGLADHLANEFIAVQVIEEHIS
jgi:hypothetical protein